MTRPGMLCYLAMLFFSCSLLSQTVNINYDNVISQSPDLYGFEMIYITEDSTLFLDRYKTANPNILRFQFPMFRMEPVNDNNDPNVSTINFSQDFVFDQNRGKTTNYTIFLQQILRDIPDISIYLNIWDCANWLASTQNTFFFGASGAWPPTNYSEYQEVVRASADWLINTVGVPADRLLITFVNEPNSDTSFPTHAFEGDVNDVLAMAAAARQALDQVSTQIKMGGIEEVFNTTMTREFMSRGGGQYIDFLAFHVYQVGSSSVNQMISTMTNNLTQYGLPIYLTEMGDNAYGPGFTINYNSIDAGISLTRNLIHIWKLPLAGFVMFRFCNTYLHSPTILPFEGWVGYGLFEDWRGTNTNGNGYQLFPGYWAHANFFNHVINASVIDNSHGVSRLDVLSAKNTDEVVIVASNDADNDKTITFSLQNTGGTNFNYLRVINSLESVAPFDSGGISNNEFNYTIPSYSARLFIMSEEGVTGIDQGGGDQPLATSFGLNIYPNPVNATATIRYTMPAQDRLAINLIDVSGRLVRTLYSGTQNAGDHTFRLQADDISSGIYFVQMISGSLQETKKLFLMK